MTAEIAVMNKWAVALAADSKVTISGMRASKTYDTVNKVFTLSKFHPVGVMIYGNAEFMSYPWETVIKLYRKQKRQKCENTVADWAADFIRYLRRFGDIKEEHRSQNIENICLSWFARIEETVSFRARAQGIALGTPEYAELFERELRDQAAMFSSKKAWAKKLEQKKILEQHRQTIGKAINDSFGGFERPELIEAAVAFVLPAVFSVDFSPQFSGFVVAGFGEKEYFPTVIEYKTDGYVGTRLKLSTPEVSDIGRDMRSCIKAFAQKEMVQRFMNGVDPKLFEFVSTHFIGAVLENALQALDKYGTKANKTDAVYGRE